MLLNIIVVLYNSELESSNTLQSLLSSQAAIFHNSRLIIINNGPCIVTEGLLNELEVKFSEIHFHQLVVNSSLARIYNVFIKSYGAKYHMLLDDDSSLSSEFFLELGPAFIATKYDVFIPRIKCGGVDFYPCYIKDKIISTVSELTDIDGSYELQSITSGLVISNGLYEKFLSQYGDCFDERFILYCIDTSFFHRLHDSKFKCLTLNYILEHDLSHVTNKTTSESSFRKDDISLAIAACCFSYYRPKYFKITFMAVVVYIFKLNFKKAWFILISFLAAKVVRS
jgi:GT2 family glycosyltransferase